MFLYNLIIYFLATALFIRIGVVFLAMERKTKTGLFATFGFLFFILAFGNVIEYIFGKLLGSEIIIAARISSIFYLFILIFLNVKLKTEG